MHFRFLMKIKKNLSRLLCKISQSAGIHNDQLLYEFNRLIEENRKSIEQSNLLFSEKQLLSNGALLAQSVIEKQNIESLKDVEFGIFSQFGDDGIIQWLIHHLELPNKTFIEFGVENYRESNTRFLLMHNNWSGLIIDGSKQNILDIKQSEYYWKHDLTAIECFIDSDNINKLISSSGFQTEVGILHIDIDGNDYWLWEAITEIRPIIVIMEYNSVFGSERAITTPYRNDFNRTLAHHSNLYFGASLQALKILSLKKGYIFIGCNSAGNNAYFIRNDKLNHSIKECDIQKGFVDSKFRESRNQIGDLTYISGPERLSSIKGLPVFNVITNSLEPL
jgi:hypothetical protein